MNVHECIWCHQPMVKKNWNESLFVCDNNHPAFFIAISLVYELSKVDRSKVTDSEQTVTGSSISTKQDPNKVH